MSRELIAEHSTRGSILLLRGDSWQQAAREFEAALALLPTGVEAIESACGAATAYTRLIPYDSPKAWTSDEFRRAIELKDWAVMRDQASGGAYFSDPLNRAGTFEHDYLHTLYARHLATNTSPREAIEYLDRTLRRLWSIPLLSCWSELGGLYIKIGAKEHAITCYQRVAAIPRVRIEDQQEDRVRAWSAQELAKLKSPSCFIATAAYDDAFAPEVIALRTFRDTVLTRSLLGRVFVRGYYLVSPPLAALVSRSATRRRFVRIVLRPVVTYARAVSRNQAQSRPT